MRDCLFCRICEGFEDAQIIYEDDHICCFLDKYPISLGHVLVVPKQHYVEFTDVDPRILGRIITAAQKVARALETTLGTDGTTVMQNNGVFKDVDHYHLHVFPRYKGDGFSWVEPEIYVTKDDILKIHADLVTRITG